MNMVEARQILDRALAGVRQESYSDLVARAPMLRSRTRFLGITFAETFAPMPGGYITKVDASPSGVLYTVTVDVFWDDYDDRVIRVMVCVDDGGPSATRPLCESLVVTAPGAGQAGTATAHKSSRKKWLRRKRGHDH